MDTPVVQPPVEIEINIPVRDIQTEWSRCSLLANYIAEYVAFEYSHREWAENLLSTISNELLETAVALAPPISDLRLKINKEENAFVISMTHLVNGSLLPHYQTFIQSLESDQKYTLYLNWLTDNIITEHQFNQLGLCMISNDFDAQLQVYSESGERIQTRLHLPIKEQQL